MTLRDARIRAERRDEAGAALLVTMLLLTAMALIGFASLNTVMRDRETTGFSNQGQTALYGADAAMSASLDVVRKEILGTAIGRGTCLSQPIPSSTLPNGVTYGPDDTAPSNLICMLAAAEPCPATDSSIESGSGSIFLNTIWSLRGQGTAPTGATSRVMATAERCHAFSN